MEKYYLHFTVLTSLVSFVIGTGIGISSTYSLPQITVCGLVGFFASLTLFGIVIPALDCIGENSRRHWGQ